MSAGAGPRQAHQPADFRLCVAPMMDWTDRHCRVFHRLLAPNARLYTEMVHAQAVIHGDRARLLDFDASEHPLELVEQALRSLWEGKEAPPAYLERLGLAEAHSFKDLLVRRLFAGNL